MDNIESIKTDPNAKHGPPSAASRKRVIELLQYDDPTTWDIPWKQNVTPWTKGTYHPSLREVVEDTGIEFPKGHQKRALVPGCGEGHDVIYIASTLGLRTTGLDISQTAIERATSVVNSSPDAPKDLIDFQVRNFFSLAAETEADKFDLIYDFTFFVAIHPSQRPEWGKQMAALIKPGGYLITLVFPMEPKSDVGPPWYLRPEHYDEPLAGHFVKVLDKVPERLPTGWPEGRQHLLVWQRV